MRRGTVQRPGRTEQGPLGGEQVDGDRGVRGLVVPLGDGDDARREVFELRAQT